MSGDKDWMRRAACKGVDPVIFYPKNLSAVENYGRARRICLSCPVKRSCLAYAIAHREKWGMWGGTTPSERRELGRGFRQRVRIAWFKMYPSSKYSRIVA